MAETYTHTHTQLDTDMQKNTKYLVFLFLYFFLFSFPVYSVESSVQTIKYYFGVSQSVGDTVSKCSGEGQKLGEMGCCEGLRNCSGICHRCCPVNCASNEYVATDSEGCSYCEGCRNTSIGLTCPVYSGTDENGCPIYEEKSEKDCDDGEYLDTGSCSCKSCSIPSKTVCDESAITYDSNGCPLQKYEPCGANEHCVNNMCQFICDPGYILNEETGECEICTEDCSGCPDTYYINPYKNNQCTRCPSGAISSEDYATCICPPGEYLMKNRLNALVCSFCPGNTYYDQWGATSSSQCMPCPAGYAPIGPTDHSDCRPCAEGTYIPAGSSYCIGCPSGYGATTATGCTTQECACQKCGDGTYPVEEDIYENGEWVGTKAYCKPCPEGKFGTDGKCSYCPLGYAYKHQTGCTTRDCACQKCGDGEELNSSASDKFTCTPCKSGYFGTGGICRSCPSGTVGTGVTGCTTEACACKECEPGTGGWSCDLCEPGTYCPGGWSIYSCSSTDGYTGRPNVYGAKTFEEGCYRCGDGEESDAFNDYVGCVKCSAGRYGEGGKCTSCPSGYAKTDAVGCTTLECACKKCDQDGYQESYGACVPCSAGSWGTGGKCNNWCSRDSGYGASGKLGATTMAEACVKCADGYGQGYSSGVCEKCPYGTYGTGGVCHYCPDGSIGLKEGAKTEKEGCLRCPCGTMPRFSGTGAGNSCEPCPVGRFGKTPTDGNCTGHCPGGYGETGKTGCVSMECACVKCKPGEGVNYYVSTVGSGRYGCSACAAGYFGNDGSCKSCQSEGYHKGATGATGCTTASCACIL